MRKKRPMPAAKMQSLGGKARAAALSKEKRSEIAKMGAAARVAKLTCAERSRIAKQAVRAREAKRKAKAGEMSPKLW